jgi:hypothetical protein
MTTCYNPITTKIINNAINLVGRDGINGDQADTVKSP